MSDGKKQEAEQRMLEVLLAETFEAQAEHDRGTGAAAGDEPAPIPSLPSRRASWPVAAAVLLGVGVVSMLMLGGGDAPDAPSVNGEAADVTPQDPKPPELVRPPSLKELVAYLSDVERIDVVSRRTVGSSNRNSSLFVSGARLPIKAEDVAAWCQEIHRSSGRKSKNLTFRPGDDATWIELFLPGNQYLAIKCSIGPVKSNLYLPGHLVEANHNLRKLLHEARLGLDVLQRLQDGVVKHRSELENWSFASGRMVLPHELAVDAGSPKSFAVIENLVLDGGDDLRALQVVSRMPALRRLELRSWRLDARHLIYIVRLPNLEALVLRDCAGLDTAALRALGALRKLRTLHCIGTVPGGADVDLSGLMAWPALQELGLQMRPRFDNDALADLQRTKIQRLWLVGTTIEADLAGLAQCPSLRELMLVANRTSSLSDEELRRLASVPRLRRLIVRNTDAIGWRDPLQEAMPECTIDWAPYVRWLDPEYGFEYADGLAPLPE